MRQVRMGLALLGAVLGAGTLGYVVLGFGVLDALYQTVTTVTTVGFREVRPLTTTGKIFTIVLILVGVGTALYTFGLLLQVLIEGELRDVVRRRRMGREIERMSGHVVVCGWGRVGREVARFLAGGGERVVVVDRDETRLATAAPPHLVVLGDATEDDTLRRAGVARARALVAALDTDADNLFVTVSSRALRADLVIIARARDESSEAKLMRAGATRVVNPQRIGGSRMAAFARQPHVVDFLDVVMHDGSLEFRLEEVAVPPGSPLAGCTLRDAQIRDRTGALVLAIRGPDGKFTTNPPPEAPIRPDDILIAIGTTSQLAALRDAACIASGE